LSIDNLKENAYLISRTKHPSKEIERVLVELELLGWQVEKAKGKSAHAWGFVLCPANAQNLCRSGIFCRMSVWSTPSSPQKHARELQKKAQGCVVKKGNDHEH
jgi:hypothetical protein